MNRIFLIENEKKKEISYLQLNEVFPNIEIEFSGTDNDIEIAGDISFGIQAVLNIRVLGDKNKVNIGSKSHFNRNVKIIFQARGPNFKANNCSCFIGDSCIFNGGNVLFYIGEENTNVVIGAECLFANNILISTTDNHYIYDIDTLERVNIPGDVVIGNHVWLGRDVTVLNNSVVSDNSVIATKCLVSAKFLEKNVVLGGVPAKIIRHNINWKL